MSLNVMSIVVTKVIEMSKSKSTTGPKGTPFTCAFCWKAFDNRKNMYEMNPEKRKPLRIWLGMIIICFMVVTWFTFVFAIAKKYEKPSDFEFLTD
ncbi:unnamed protein product [Oppiella nova]|uniref:Uncharacterized protein n=1 Tax=Oppiella nova TaxID=334625 RepID=A0A7R9QWM2_9ACAR|nr:unnamed protein product [Oppiella nova]CAG2177088.1 unnamed protein product [Oppiella nova]